MVMLTQKNGQMFKVLDGYKQNILQENVSNLYSIIFWDIFDNQFSHPEHMSI